MVLLAECRAREIGFPRERQPATRNHRIEYLNVKASADAEGGTGAVATGGYANDGFNIASAR
jgi:hypothetical protein